MLGMYRAELARVLHLRCEDIGQFAAAKKHLQPGTQAWQQAVMFIRFYQKLFDGLHGSEAAMHHWLRAENKEAGGVPLLLIIDEDQLLQVLDFCEHCFIAQQANSNI